MPQATTCLRRKTLEGNQTPQLGHTAHGPLCTPAWAPWLFWCFSRFFSLVGCLAKLLLDRRPVHAMCVGRHVWIRYAMCREAPSPPCPGEKGHHAPSSFSCMFKRILTNLVQSDCSMKPHERWTGIVLQVGSSSGANQHRPIDGHGTPPV